MQVILNGQLNKTHESSGSQKIFNYSGEYYESKKGNKYPHGQGVLNISTDTEIKNLETYKGFWKDGKFTKGEIKFVGQQSADPILLNLTENHSISFIEFRTKKFTFNGVIARNEKGLIDSENFNMKGKITDDSLRSFLFCTSQFPLNIEDILNLFES